MIAATPASRRLDELGRVCLQVALFVFPVMLTTAVLVIQFGSRKAAPDFNSTYYPAAFRLLGGQSPYGSTAAEIQQGVAFVYPALAAVVLAPFALLSLATADHLYSCLCLLLVPVTLWLMGIRDWRIYGVALLWRPVLVGWQEGNVSVPLACLAALTWRYRDKPLVAGMVVAVVVSLKPLMWPLGLWLLATRRWKAAAWMLGSGLILNLLAWQLVGFGQIHPYLHATSLDVRDSWRTSYSVIAAVGDLGAGHTAGTVLMLTLSAALCLGMIRCGLRGRSAEAFSIATALMLVSSPLVWIHYYVLLLLPIALARPRLSLLWFVPLAMWACPTAVDSGWEALVCWCAAAICLAVALRRAPFPRGQARGTGRVETPRGLALTRGT